MTLFPNFREAVRREFRATRVGRLLTDVERMARRGGVREVEKRLLTRFHTLPAFRAALLGTPSGREFAAVERYARGDALFDAVMQALGPIGSLMSAMLRPGGGPQASSRRELAAAEQLLKAFGYKVEAPGPQASRTPEAAGFTTSPPPEPPARPDWMRGPSRGRVELRIGGRRRQYQPDDPVLTGEMIPVESSNVHSIGFLWNHADAMKGTLKVRFLQQSRGRSKGKVPGPTYFYHGVHPDVFDAFRRAASKGVFVWDRLRIRGTVSGHRFHYELKGIAQGYVPRKAVRFGRNEYFVGRQVRAQRSDGRVRILSSDLPDAKVQRLPENFRGWPERGLPDRGEPNRGR